MILIVGADGNMGRRYQAILRFLKRDYICVDKRHSQPFVKGQISRSSGVIIATPTDTHTAVIRQCIGTGKPILCEKPITKDVRELKILASELQATRTPLRMVMQYELLQNPNGIGRTFYNYFRHGTDGLVWDCTQIIGLARGDIKLEESSPTWQCMINGKSINIAHMDAAYIGYVQKWLALPSQDLGRIIAIHEKTAEFEKVVYGNVH